MRRLTAFFGTLLLILLLAIGAHAADMSLYYDGQWTWYSADDIYLEINGQKIETKEMPPIALMGRTLVPVREVFESIGGTVDWVPGLNQIMITYNGNYLFFTLDSRNIFSGDNTTTIPANEPAPMAINNKTMVPIRVVADLLGFSVSWDEARRTVMLTEDLTNTTTTPSDTSVPDIGSLTGAEIINGVISKIVPTTENGMDLIYLAYGSPVEPKIYRYNSPERVVLDFDGARLSENSSGLTVNGGTAVTSVRSANHDTMARVVLDVKSQPNIVVGRTDTGIVIAVSPASGNYTTTVNDLTRGAYFDPSSYVPSNPSAGGQGSSNDVHLDTSGTVDTTGSLKLDYTSIVIDPGHGRKSGASRNGVMEDDINLAIGLKVRDKLLAAGYNVIMTRNSDTYPSLQDRVDIASTPTRNGEIPALFVSIHCNSFEENLSVNGTQVYYHPDSKYGTILAENIYNRDVANTTLYPRQIHDGSTLFVIRKTLQPAALVETAFLTNDSDRAYLVSAAGQEALATGIAEGIIMTMEQMKSDKGIK